MPVGAEWLAHPVENFLGEGAGAIIIGTVARGEVAALAAQARTAA